MNKSNLKSYAPQARKDWYAAVTTRAALLGITASHVSPVTVSGGVALIDGVEWPAKVAAQRQALLNRIARHNLGGPAGFAQTMEEVAYTWFNRFAALRYMELHELLDHGHRVLSSRDGGLPELLRHAAEVSLPGIHTAQVQTLQLAGNQDNALYKRLLVAQCNELSRTMPFLFERIDDDTELLLPDNLLRTDSVIAKLVQEIPEGDWAEVEIIGWLYQFYISEKKDQVIGKVVKSEDIPAATQLFTPNWIVQYLVQNSVGRLWLMANPASTLASQWPYYIQPASQTPEVQAQLDALIQTRMDEDGGTLNPESITVLDPACGSGHILVVAYDVLKAIYLERGYQARAIPRLILEKNLYGLDIDDRAAQMAGFALLMKARFDDRRLFNEPPKLNVLSLQESKGLDADALSEAINAGGTERVNVAQLRWLIDTFEHAKTFGSLIQIGLQPTSNLRNLLSIVQQSLQAGDLYAQAAAQDVLPLVRQALVLGMQFDAVVANPPYISGKYLAPLLKSYLRDNYTGFDKDLFSSFMIRNLMLTRESGQLGFMSPFVWMFIASYEELRLHFIESASLTSLVQLEYSGFDGATVPICTFTLAKSHVANFNGAYVRLAAFRGSENQGPKTLEAIHNRNCGWFYSAKSDDFKKISGSPIAYWASKKIFSAFERNVPIENYATFKQGMATSDNGRFLRLWHEVDFLAADLNCENPSDLEKSSAKWFPYNKGGAYRKWYGNNDYFVNWKSDGEEMKAFTATLPQGTWVRLKSREYYCLPNITYSGLSSGEFGCRLSESGFLFDTKGSCIFAENNDQLLELSALLNSKVSQLFLKILCPTLDYSMIGVKKVPAMILKGAASYAKDAKEIAKIDWDFSEVSWGFSSLDICSLQQKSLEAAWVEWSQKCLLNLRTLKGIEEENNRLFINAYGLQDELTPEVPEEQITLARADREKDCQRLISYAIGCMMGRYSLDEPGLIYAHSGNVGFDASRYATFPADADGIVPLTDELWFTDDATNRVREFLLAVWGADTLEENMAWLAESLGTKASRNVEFSPDETIRRYLADKFFKDHLQTYKKRPIYWLFSSGKQGAFQALVYLHRYTEGTLARLRAEYVIPLSAKMANRLEMLEQDALAATSTPARTKLRKQMETLRKQQAELLAYDEKLRHYADMRITLDLDDGVKVNYGKFGDLLEGVKLVTGGSGDE